MNRAEGNLYQELLDLFRQYNAIETYSLISWIAVMWGREMVKGELAPPTDWESEADYRSRVEDYRDDVLQSIFDRGYPGPHERLKDPGKELSVQDLQNLTDKWSARLASLPFKETKETFAAAAHEWLLTCDLSGFDPILVKIGDDRESVLGLLRWLFR